MKTVVMVTPTSLDRDSRTLKQAASAGRFGYATIVVEGVASRSTPAADPVGQFTVLPIGRSSRAAGEAYSDRPQNGRLRSWYRRLRNTPGAGLLVPVAATRALAAYVRTHVLGTLRALPNADLYHLHAPYQFPAVWLKARRQQAPIVYDAHDFYSGIRLPNELTLHERIVVQPIYDAIERICVRQAREVITVSDGVADLIETKFGRRPVVLRNTDDQRLHRQPGRGLRELLHLKPDDFVMITIGQVKAGQAWEALAGALARVPPSVHLAVLGGGYTEVKAMFDARGLGGRAHFIGHVPPGEVVPLASEADLGLVIYAPRSANYIAALPNGFFQCIAAGLPVLYPPLPEIARIGERYQLGTQTDPTNEAELALSIAGMVDNASARTAFRSRASAAAAELDWAREETKLAVIYERLLAERAG